MRYEDFVHSPAGRLVPTVFDAQAFLPNALPPQVKLDLVALDLAEAMASIGELRGACRRLLNPYILIRPLQRLEAQTSSAMEGTHSTNDELVLAEAGVERDVGSEVREVNNYLSALSWAVVELKQLPISARLICGIHERLLKGVGRDRGQDKLPGCFKRDQNMIGGARLETARFIPPPPLMTPDAVSDLEKYVNREDKTGSAALLDMALAHYQFETIHPFADGNGRVGRMLISLMAITENLLEVPVLYMSPELERVKDEYIDLMYAVSSKGEWEAWISFFLKALTRSARRTVETIDRVLALQSSYHDRVKAASRSSNALTVVDMLFERPVIRVKEVVERLSVTDAAARNILRQLSELEIVHESKAYYPAVWFARELAEISRPAPL
ncbi:Fic family protein [Paracoccus aminovorans]|uniref:Fic family protein n=1 Tax=Paracoccus aminovorans TaxID=34004 RepID=UPI002B25ADB1|nr:Fic family protein [Paracoccus aminovorans]